MRELNFNKECSSSYICKYYGAFIDVQSATISIAMEFCEGGSLDSIYRMVKSRGGRTGEKVLGKIAEGVLEGLTYLSGRKIIHRGSWVTLHSYRPQAANCFIQISSLRTYCCAEMGKSSYATLVSLESFLGQRVMQIPSLELPTIWRYVSHIFQYTEPCADGLKA